MSETGAKPYHHGNLKNALLAAGMEIIETDGVAGLSLRTLAAKVGVSHTAPKNHFGSMKGLMTAIATEGFQRFAAEMRAGVTSASNRQDKLKAAMQGYVRFAQAHPELFKIMFSPDFCDQKQGALLKAAQDSYSVLSEISDGLDWHKSDAPDAQVRTEIMLWSLAHGYAVLSNSGQLDQPGAHSKPPGILSVMPDFRYRDPSQDRPPS